MKISPPFDTHSNNFCMPYSLATLTGKSIEECVALLKEQLGDVPITGVFFPVGRRILVNLGFECRDIDPATKEKAKAGKTYLVEVPGHVVVVNDGTIYDNGTWRNAKPVNFLTHVLRVIEVGAPDEIL